MTSLGSFIFLPLFLSPTSVELTPEAEVSLDFLESFLSLFYFFFLSFLALLEASDFRVEVKALEALESSLRYIAPWV